MSRDGVTHRSRSPIVRKVLTIIALTILNLSDMLLPRPATAAPVDASAADNDDTVTANTTTTIGAAADEAVNNTVGKTICAAAENDSDDGDETTTNDLTENLTTGRPTNTTSGITTTTRATTTTSAITTTTATTTVRATTTTSATTSTSATTTTTSQQSCYDKCYEECPFSRCRVGRCIHPNRCTPYCRDICRV